MSLDTGLIAPGLRGKELNLTRGGVARGRVLSHVQGGLREWVSVCGYVIMLQINPMVKCEFKSSTVSALNIHSLTHRFTLSGCGFALEGWGLALGRAGLLCSG